jgi:hypothetical protein
VHDRVDTREVAPVGVAIPVEQIGDLHTLDGLALSVGDTQIEQGQIIPFSQSRQYLAGDLSGGAGH